MGSLPLNTVLHELPQHGSFPQAAILHKLLQWKPPSQGPVPQEQATQHEFPSGSQVLPTNLLQHGLLSPQGHRSCQETALASALHGGTDSFRHSAYPVWDPPRAAVGPLLQNSLPWTAGGQPVLPCLHHRLEGNLLWCLEHLLPLLHHWPWCLHSSCSHFSLLFLKCSCVAPLNHFLNILSHSCPQWALLWPLVDPSYRQLALALSDMSEALVSSHRSHLCSPPDTKTLPQKPRATFSSYHQWWSLIHETPLIKLMMVDFLF